VRAGERTHPGTVVDLSLHGLFVQTRLQLRTRERVPVRVRLRLPGRRDELSVAAELVRQLRVPAALASAAGGGLGLAIRRAPDAWPDLLNSLSPHGLLTQRGEPTTPRAKPAVARCRLCGAPPAEDARLCQRCADGLRRSA
jgi:hypothetical protein